MEKGFYFTDPAKPEPIRIEQVFAEKPGGGVVSNPTTDLPPTTPVVFDETTEQFKPIDKADTSTKPDYVTGGWVYAGKGDQQVRLINGANLRKETAIITKEQAALIPTINLV